MNKEKYVLIHFSRLQTVAGNVNKTKHFFLETIYNHTVEDNILFRDKSCSIQQLKECKMWKKSTKFILK